MACSRFSGLLFTPLQFGLERPDVIANRASPNAWGVSVKWRYNRRITDWQGVIAMKNVIALMGTACVLTGVAAGQTPTQNQYPFQNRNPRTIVVLKASFPFAINWVQENVPAIVHMAHNSQEEGSALADVLFGDYNPSGRLVETWVKSEKDLPDLLNYNLRHGRTYMYFKGEPLYPFGFGLSYTTFAYSNLRTGTARVAKDGEVTISVNVRNTGTRDGQEVVQLYVKHVDSKVERPIKELKGFRRVALKAGETKTVQMKLQAKDLAYWDAQKKQWVVEGDKVNLMLGGSSADVKVQKTITVNNAGS